MITFNPASHVSTSTFPRRSNHLKGIVFLFAALLTLSAVHGQTNDSFIRFDYRNRLIKLNLRLNASAESHAFILDSGAPTFLTDSLVEAYGLAYLNSERVSDVNGNTRNMDFYSIGSIELGGNRLHGIETASNPQVASMPIMRGHHYAGLLGANAMQNRVWEINYACRKITLTGTPEEMLLPESGHLVSMKPDELGRPVITLIIAQKYKVDVIVDVAYNGSLLLPDRFFSKPIFNDSLSHSSQEQYSAGFETKTKQMDYKYLQTISIGDMKLENVKASASGSNDIALIGNEFLENYTILLDFIDKRMAFLPAEAQCKSKSC